MIDCLFLLAYENPEPGSKAIYNFEPQIMLSLFVRHNYSF